MNTKQQMKEAYRVARLMKHMAFDERFGMIDRLNWNFRKDRYWIAEGWLHNRGR